MVLELIDSKQQERYWCPPLLHRAAIAFLHALWQDRRDSAMLVLRTKWVLFSCGLFCCLYPIMPFLWFIGVLRDNFILDSVHPSKGWAVCVFWTWSVLSLGKEFEKPMCACSEANVCCLLSFVQGCIIMYLPKNTFCGIWNGQNAARHEGGNWYYFCIHLLGQSFGKTWLIHCLGLCLHLQRHQRWVTSGQNGGSFVLVR